MDFKKYKRIFLIVADSAGIGEEPDAARFGDVGTNTCRHSGCQSSSPSPECLFAKTARGEQRKRHYDWSLGNDGD